MKTAAAGDEPHGPRAVPATAPRARPNLELTIGVTLRWGTALVGLLLVLALLLAWLHGGWPAPRPPSPGTPVFAHLIDFWDRLRELRPSAVAVFALLILLALPPARVVLAA